MSAWSWAQTLPEPPAPDDVNAVALYFATIAFFTVGWLGRRVINDAARNQEKAEKARDEMTPLVREITDLLKSQAEASERRDADLARLIGELANEVKGLRKEVESVRRAATTRRAP